MSTAIDKILSKSAKAAEEPVGYRAYIDSGGRPQMGFSLTHANGNMDGFLYHLLDNISLETDAGQDFLSFTHRGKAVTLQGTQLRELFRALIKHTLMEIHQKDGRTAEPGQPVVTRAQVSVVGQEEKVVRLAG